MATLSDVTGSAVTTGNLITQTKDLINSSNTSGNKNAIYIPELKDNISKLEASKVTTPYLIPTIQDTIDSANATIIKIQKNLLPPPPNVAKVTSKGKLVDPPKDPNVNQNSGGPENPSLSRGIVANTAIDVSNNSLEHVCDFISEMQKNINLKKYTKALANQLREAIRWVMVQLGLTDATGQYSWLIAELKAFAIEAKRIQKEIIQPIIDFEKYVLAYVAKLRAMVQWILSLPAKLLALLQDCLKKLLLLIKNIFADAMQGFSEAGDPNSADILTEAKAAANAAYDTVKLASTAVAGAVAIPIAATAGLLVPVSQSDLTAANATIAAYEQPTAEQSANPIPTQNKSTP